MYKYLLFDLDGTLTDSGEGIMNSIAYALSKFGINDPDREVLLKFIGPPLVVSFAKYYNLNEEECEKALAYYRKYFAVKGMYENRVYDGIREVLEEIRKTDRVLILATSKPEFFTEKILEYFDLKKYFDFVAGATLDGTRSHKVDVVRYALEISNSEKNQTLMIGDRNEDIRGAGLNGIDGLGVAYGYGTENELIEAGAKYIAHSPDEILKYI